MGGVRAPVIHGGSLRTRRRRGVGWSPAREPGTIGAEGTQGAGFRSAFGAVAWRLCIALYDPGVRWVLPSCGVSSGDQAVISWGWSVLDWISMRRGFAFSATGIRRVR